eukprot:2242032-Heterocapsa_arctica.AAC.1
MHRWAVEVWKAANQEYPRAFTLPKLRAHWEASCSSKNLSWRTARGPMANARLEARRLGWYFEGPFKLRTNTGQAISLIEMSPKMIQTMLMQAHHVKLEQKAAVNLGVVTFDSDR